MMYVIELFSLIHCATVTFMIAPGFSEKEKGSHADKIRSSFALAVQEGIIDELEEEDKNGVHLISRNLSFESFSSLIDENENDIINGLNKHFEFRHSSWRRKLLSLLLDSYKRDIDKIRQSI